MGVQAGVAAEESGGDFWSDGFWKGAIAGFASGAAGAFSGAAAVESFGTPGIIPGALVGGATGSAAGGLTGGMTSWAMGNDFWDGAQQGALVGGIGGMIGGGYEGFLNAKELGINIWTGSGISEFKSGINNEVSLIEARKNAISYNKGQYKMNDEVLKIRYKDYYGIQEGDFNINQITTKMDPKLFGLHPKGSYINLDNGSLVGGYTRYRWGFSEIHIAPSYAIGDKVDFLAVGGHELIHSMHNYLFNGPVRKAFTESIAYKYSHAVYLSNGNFSRAFNIKMSAMENGWWKTDIIKYSLPSPYGIH
jgi:hypothetical protein